MADTKLITSAEVKTLVGLRSNLDPAKLDPYIVPSQRNSLRQEITFDLYAEIIAQKLEDNLTDANKLLLDEYISPYLAYMVVWYSIDFIQWDLSDLGLMESDDENATISDYSIVKSYKANLNNLAQSMLQDLRMFILDNIDDYPAYNPQAKKGAMTKRAGIIFYDTKGKVRCTCGACSSCINNC